MKNKYASFPLAMAGLAFLCFLFIAFFMSTAAQPLWGRISVLLIPALVLGSIGLFALKGLFDSKITAVLTVVLSVIFLLVSICYTFLLFIWTATTDTEAEWHRINNWGFYDTDSVRYHLYWDGGFNHGEMCYALVDPSICRITFCYEDW